MSKRVHLLANFRRHDAVVAAQKTAFLLKNSGVAVFSHHESALILELPEVSDSEFGACDLAISFGGDGTLIRIAQLCSELGTPVLGVYYGRFGFVTQCTGEMLDDCLAAFLDDRSVYEPRMMLHTDLLRGGQVIATIHSLNETVLQRAVTVRMLNFAVKVNGHDLTTYPADGVMVSTATGSTGYNLSAGGPIMDPRVNALVLTAIAPHTLSARTLVLHDESQIQISMETEGEAVLSADSQIRLHLLSGDEILVKKSDRVTHLLVVDSDDFLIKLGKRLFWSFPMAGGNT